jgi:lysophospholipase L1-like esterase
MALRTRSMVTIFHSGIAVLLAALFMPPLSYGQVGVPKSAYYLGLGDSISAGEGALPVTHGFVYRLYDHSVFGSKQEMEFSNIAIRAAQTWHVLEHQVPQAICINGFQPTLVTITIGANDFFAAVPNVDLNAIASIASRTGEIVNRLLNGFVYPDATSPGKAQQCPGLPNVTVLVANNFAVPHPDPAIAQTLDKLAGGYDELLRLALSSLTVPAGSRIAVVDLYSAFKGLKGLLLIRNGGVSTGPGPFDIEVHPNNLGHLVIARQFERAWEALNSLP